MATPIEIPVVVPGAEDATQKMQAFKSALGQTTDSAAKFKAGVKDTIPALNDAGEAANNASKHHRKAATDAEEHATAMRHLGGELRHTSSVAGEALRGLASEFAPILIGAEGLKVAFDTMLDAANEKMKQGQEQVKTFADAMTKAREAADKAAGDEGKSAKDYLEKNRAVIGGLAAVGHGASGLATDLSKETGIAPEKVNQAVLSGMQAGLSREQVSALVRGAATGESLGRGKFEDLAAGGARIGKLRGGSYLSGGNEEVASALLNAKAIEKFEDPKEARARQIDEASQAVRSGEAARGAWQDRRAALQAQGRYAEAAAMGEYQGGEYELSRFNAKTMGERGTSALDLRLELNRRGHGAAATAADVIARTTNNAAAGNQAGVPATGQAYNQQQAQLDAFNKEHPGIVDRARELQGLMNVSTVASAQRERAIQDTPWYMGPYRAFVPGETGTGPVDKANREVVNTLQGDARAYHMTPNNMEGLLEKILSVLQRSEVHVRRLPSDVVPRE